MRQLTINSQGGPAQVPILGVGVSVVSMPRAVETISDWIRSGHKTYVCVANTHLVTECQRDSQLKRIHNQAGMVTPDGMPLVWISHLSGHKQVQRVYGPDLLLAMCKAGLSCGLGHYFYGGAPGVCELLAARLRTQFPDLRIVGTHSPPFRQLSDAELEQDLDRINASNADIVWVGLGAPKQEQWMATHRDHLTASVLIGVGAAFDFHAGVKKQAPRWMQRHGLEWLFRLACEPRRLWKRYAINNSLFAFYTMMEWLRICDFREPSEMAAERGNVSC